MESRANLLANYISSLPEFQIIEWRFDSYNHMGGILTDSILQAGLNYESVVKPRVDRLVNMYPDAATTPGFKDLISFHGTKTILQWKHDEKPRRLEELTDFLVSTEVYTKTAFQQWLSLDENCDKLLRLRGVGPKTIDYMKNLAGVQAIAIDRHIHTLISQAGLSIKNYYDAQAVLIETAYILQVSIADLDRSIWQFVALSSR